MLCFEPYASAVEQAIRNLLPLAEKDPVPQAVMAGEIPQPLRSAMAYSLQLPGKRIRPVLLLAAYHLLQKDWEAVLPFACALEMIHTYSLIHDDLPAMDNDILRRGQPTNHVVYGEAMAILAGDGLLNLAYETMLGCEFSAHHPTQSLNAMAEIAKRAGVSGMIAGQSLDVRLEGVPPTEAAVRYIHLHKTADLLTAPITAGLMLAGAGEAELAAGRSYGKHLGLAFQIQDDILDCEGDTALLGKSIGKDAEEGKNTWPALVGLEQARKDAQAEADAAIEAMAPFGEKATFFRELVQQLSGRKS